MAKRPAYQWYPGDARRDTALQSCSLVVRGLWREMLDMMHDGEPYGFLTAGGVPITTEQLARMVGEPLRKVRGWLEELEQRKVFSRTNEGVIYSRRMVKDADIRFKRAEAGAMGGNPVLLNQLDNQPDKLSVADAKEEEVNKKDTEEIREDEMAIFGHWTKAKPRPRQPKFTDQRQKVIRARRARYSVEDCMLAIDGAMMSDFHRDQYDDLTTIFRNDTTLEQHRDRALSGKVGLRVINGGRPDPEQEFIDRMQKELESGMNCG